MTADELLHDFRARGVTLGGALLLPAADALELVGRARAARLPIVAVDGFDVSAGAARPDLAQSVDFGGASCRTNPWAEAEAFLDERAGSALHFAVALGEAPSPVGPPPED